MTNFDLQISRVDCIFISANLFNGVNSKRGDFATLIAPKKRSLLREEDATSSLNNSLFWGAIRRVRKQSGSKKMSLFEKRSTKHGDITVNYNDLTL